MSRLADFRGLACIVSCAAMFAAASPPAQAQSKFPNLGRTATPAEIKAWDIDVRPDFKGLPPGSGSVAKGQDVWEAKCESCHGAFGESNEVFTPVIGHTTAADIATGRVASLRGDTVPQRTTMMKLSQLSTLWDYVNRAMPWNAPKSLSSDEVYAVVAYILNMGNVVPADFVLSDRNIAATQAKLPNRNGITTAHGMWDVNGKPDVQGSRCERDCAQEVRITSRLPDYARNAHGNLAEQNRIIGAVRGADTTRPARATLATVSAGASEAKPAATAAANDPLKLAQKHACMACHGTSNKIVGPAFSDIHKKYGKDAAATLAAKIKAGGSGVWGSVPMPPQTQVPAADIQAIADWIAAGKF